jgi:nucleoid DNA-binding protein
MTRRASLRGQEELAGRVQQALGLPTKKQAEIVADAVVAALEATPLNNLGTNGFTLKLGSFGKFSVRHKAGILRRIPFTGKTRLPRCELCGAAFPRSKPRSLLIRARTPPFRGSISLSIAQSARFPQLNLDASPCSISPRRFCEIHHRELTVAHLCRIAGPCQYSFVIGDPQRRSNAEKRDT